MTLLTVEDFKLRVTTSLADAVIQDKLDAAEEAIVAYAGPLGEQTEVLDGGQSYLFLRHRAAVIAEIKETVYGQQTTLATNDYRLRPDLVSILRLHSGTNPPPMWGGSDFWGPEFGPYSSAWGANVSGQSHTPWGHIVSVKYTPFDDTAERKRVQEALVRLDLNYNPGVTMEQIGSWTEQRSAQSAAWNVVAEREMLLQSLIRQETAPGFA